MLSKKRLTVLMVLLLIVSLLAVACSPGSPGKEAGKETGGETSKETGKTSTQKHRVDIFTLSVGTSTYSLGAVIADLLNRESDTLRGTVVELAQSLAGNRILEHEPDKRNEMVVFSPAVQLWTQYNAYPPFETEYDKVKALCLTGFSATGLISIDPKIKTIYDLEGKKVAVGLPPSISRNELIQKIFEMEGVKAKFQELDFQPAADALRDGQVDAIIASSFICTQNPDTYQMSPAYIELMTQKKVNFIPYPKETFIKANASFGKGDHPSIPYTVPAGKLSDSQVDWTTVGDALGFAVHEDMDDEVVYEMLKVMHDNMEKLMEVAPVCQIIKGNLAKLGIPESWYHPAALKFFKDYGYEVGSLND